jgi:transposase
MIKSSSSYMARCVRNWAKTYIEDGIFVQHRQGRHSKRMSLLGDEDVKEKMRQWLRSHKPEERQPVAIKEYLEETILPEKLGTRATVSPSTLRRYLQEWGYSYRRNTKGVRTVIFQ